MVRLVGFHQESYLRLFKQRRFYFWQALEMGGLQCALFSNQIYSNTHLKKRKYHMLILENKFIQKNILLLENSGLVEEKNLDCHKQRLLKKLRLCNH